MALPQQYGSYFTWTVAKTGSGTDSRGNTVSSTGTDGSVCPTGWRLPTAKEIATLIGYKGTVPPVTEDWWGTVGANGGANGTYNGVKGWNFTIDGNDLFFPYASGGFEFGYFWANVAYNADRAYFVEFHSGNTSGSLRWNLKTHPFSVRCVQSAT